MPAESRSPKPTQIQLVHLGDLIDVDVIGSLEYDWRGTLTPEGFLDGLDRIPVQIFAKCRTEEAIAKEIAAELSKILRDPKVSVRILDRSKRPEAVIDGAIKTPTRFSIQRPVRLSELIILAGGFVDTASGEIEIIRPKGLSCGDGLAATIETSVPAPSNAPDVTTVRISHLLKGDQQADILIRSGDSINITQALPVFVTGGVVNPGRIASRTTLSVSRAVASAGGLARDSSAAGVTIIRRVPGGSSLIDVNLELILAGERDDVMLRPFDIVDVPFRGGTRPRLPDIPPNYDVMRPRDEMPLKIVD